MVTVTDDRKIYINEYPVDLESLGVKLSVMYQNQSRHHGVFLRADEKIPYGFVVQVMGVIREAGIEQIGMVTEPLKNPPRAQ